MSAHCSLFAPGGVSQRICQSPCTDFTTPCACAGENVAKDKEQTRIASRQSCVMSGAWLWYSCGNGESLSLFRTTASGSRYNAVRPCQEYGARERRIIGKTTRSERNFCSAAFAL